MVDETLGFVIIGVSALLAPLVMAGIISTARDPYESSLAVRVAAVVVVVLVGVGLVGLARDVAATIIAIFLGVTIYFAPLLVGAVRKVPNIGSVAVINVFAGWTLVGWVVALAMAARTVPRQVGGS